MAPGTRARFGLFLLVCAVVLPLVAVAAASGLVPVPGFAPTAATASGHEQAPGEGAAEPGAPARARGDFPVVPPAAPRRDLARDAVAAAEDVARASTELAAAVLDRRTGRLALGSRADEPFYTASLSKVLLAVDMLDRRRLEGVVLPEDDLALLRRALGPSDDSAMNALWTTFDGAGVPARLTARLGLTATTGPRDPSQWGEVSTSAADLARIWQYLLDEVPAPDRDLLLAAMGAAPPTAADGFDQSFGLLAPGVDGSAGSGAVAKQGWMCCFSGEYYLHSTGAVGPDQRFVLVLLTRQPRGQGWEAARQELDRIATAAAEAVD